MNNTNLLGRLESHFKSWKELIPKEKKKSISIEGIKSKKSGNVQKLAPAVFTKRKYYTKPSFALIALIRLNTYMKATSDLTPFYTKWRI